MKGILGILVVLIPVLTLAGPFLFCRLHPKKVFLGVTLMYAILAVSSLFLCPVWLFALIPFGGFVCGLAYVDMKYRKIKEEV